MTKSKIEPVPEWISINKGAKNKRNETIAGSQYIIHFAFWRYETGMGSHASRYRAGVQLMQLDFGHARDKRHSAASWNVSKVIRPNRINLRVLLVGHLTLERGIRWRRNSSAKRHNRWITHQWSSTLPKYCAINVSCSHRDGTRRTSYKALQ